MSQCFRSKHVVLTLKNNTVKLCSFSLESFTLELCWVQCPHLADCAVKQWPCFLIFCHKQVHSAEQEDSVRVIELETVQECLPFEFSLHSQEYLDNMSRCKACVVKESSKKQLTWVQFSVNISPIMQMKFCYISITDVRYPPRVQQTEGCNKFETTNERNSQESQLALYCFDCTSGILSTPFSCFEACVAACMTVTILFWATHKSSALDVKTVVFRLRGLAIISENCSKSKDNLRLRQFQGLQFAWLLPIARTARMAEVILQLSSVWMKVCSADNISWRRWLWYIVVLGSCIIGSQSISFAKVCVECVWQIKTSLQQK